MIQIRTARDSDAQGIAEIFRAVYGEDYCYKQFYDPDQLKRLIFAEDSVTVVAVDSGSGRILGTASVLEQKGALSDLTAEFGRLAVHPDARRQGVGHLLMEGRIERVKDRLHVGLVEARLSHPFSCKIGLRHGFAPVGFLPCSVIFKGRENLALLARHFGDSLKLRRNHPRIIPEAYQLAHLGMENCGVDFDAVVDEESAPYPEGRDFAVEEMTTDGYSTLLRIERGRLKKREIFGPMRLHYGVFKLQARDAYYLLARQAGHLAGAVGFTVDAIDQRVTIFELISLRDDVVRFLFRRLEHTVRERWEAALLEVDVSAYAPRMQRTLLELGYLPIGYIPSLAFHKVERIDILKLGKVFSQFEQPLKFLVPQCREVVKAVLRGFRNRQVQPRIRGAVGRIGLFHGLNEEQSRRLASCCRLVEWEEGEEVFRKGDPAEGILLVLKGAITIHPAAGARPIGKVAAGESVGEISALRGFVHSAAAQAAQASEAALLPVDEFNRLIRQRPDIGVVVFRNLAIGLGEKLQRADLSLLGVEEIRESSR